MIGNELLPEMAEDDKIEISENEFKQTYKLEAMVDYDNKPLKCKWVLILDL